MRGGAMSDIPTAAIREINKAVRLAAKARAMADEAEQLRKQAKEILLPLLSAYELEKYTLDKVGTVKRRVNKGASINGDKLTEQLLLAGLSATKTKNIITKSQVTWETEYVEFKVAKEG
jgi:hypothetical protein